MNRILSLGAAIFCLTFLAAPAARADSQNYFTVVEDPTGVTFSTMLQGVNYGTVYTAGQYGFPTVWFSNEYFQLLYPEAVNSAGGYIDATRFINWVDPENPNLYDTLVISPSGNHGSVSFTMESDVPGLNWNAQSGDYNYNPCTNGTGGAIPCPLLPDGASYEVPLFTYTNGNSGTLTVSFTDLGDTTLIPIPEPANYALILAGLGMLTLAYRKNIRRPQPVKRIEVNSIYTAYRRSNRE